MDTVIILLIILGPILYFIGYYLFVAKPRFEQDDSGKNKMSNKSDEDILLYLGVLGSICISIGVFAPLISGPYGSSVNYFQWNKIESIIILFLVAISLGIILEKDYKLLLFTATIILGLNMYSFYHIRMSLNYTLSEIGGLSGIASGFIQYQWGWLAFGIGLLFLYIIAFKELKD